MLEDIKREIRTCKDNCIAKLDVAPGIPLIGGTKSSKILIISQDPSAEAWNRQVLFGNDNPTARQLSKELFGIPFEKFNEEMFAWIHVSNCDTGKRGKNDRRPGSHCSKKYIGRFIEALPNLNFIVLLGTCALDYFNFQDGKDRNKYLRATHKYGEVDLSFVYHVSGSNRILNNPEIKKLQDAAIAEIQKKVSSIIGDC